MLSENNSTMPDPSQDRRAMRRFDMRLPETVKGAGIDLDEFATETQNVSARGVFFYLDRRSPRAPALK